MFSQTEFNLEFDALATQLRLPMGYMGLAASVSTLNADSLKTHARGLLRARFFLSGPWICSGPQQTPKEHPMACNHPIEHSKGP